METDIKALEKIMEEMEEMAGLPKEKMGTRQPGETCMYERKR